MLTQANVTIPSAHLDSSTLNLPFHFGASGEDVDDPLVLVDDDVLDFADDFSWMSAQPVDAARWMSLDPTGYPTGADFYAYPHHQSAHTQRAWPQNYNDGFSPYAVAHTSPQKQQQQRPHRRALSNSTASTSSPQQLPIHSQAPVNPQYQHLQNQYYPTPTQTPTQESFMDRGYNRRRPDGAPPKAYQHQLRTSAPQYGSPYGQDYPATPSTSNGDYSDRRFSGQSYAPTVPRLEPTETQACADELYAPTVGAPVAQYQINQNLLHPSAVQERLNAANRARVTTPDLKREASPYREGSQYALENPAFPRPPEGAIGTAAQQRQQQKWVDDQYNQWRQNVAADPRQQPKTISPKDAYVDNFHDPAEEDTTGPALFATASNMSQQQPIFDDNAYRAYGQINGRPPASTFSFQAPALPATAGVTPGEFKFAALQRQSSSSDEPPAHLVSMDTSKSDQSTQSTPSLPPPKPQHRPTHPSSSISAADTGTYSCTYAGCPQRFATPALLQKHKRDFHRSTAPHPSSRPSTQSPRPGESHTSASTTPTSAPLNRNSQAGPHRCDRINPSTGKPCNTIFSRPYDLTRHEDTIHARRPKVSCEYCAERGEEKTFSRADALTRHLRVVHPDVEVFGKGGRRRGL